jgi:TonB family protein
VALGCSVIFPLVHWNTGALAVPALGDVVPAYWLPGFEITAAQENAAGNQSMNIWGYAGMVYAAGIVLSLLLFVVRLLRLCRFIKASATYTLYGFNIAESSQPIPSFSFFKFIFIGQADKLSEVEKKQIIDHEAVHARQRHSFDVLLVNIIGIFFWFNPVIRIYKKKFIQLHEFEADARAVENRDVNDYCSLLARVALLSADLKLANHFNHSLTLKRIEMIRTIKIKTRSWKIAAMAAMIPLFFFATACQDQVMEDVKTVAESSTMAIDVPTEVQSIFDKMQAEKPGKKLVLIEVNGEEGKNTLEKLEGRDIASMNVIKLPNKRSFAIIEMNDAAMKAAQSTANVDRVFTVVEETATPQGGIDAFSKHLKMSLRYPSEARERKVQGNVLVSFVVQLDGTLSDFQVLRSIDPALEAEAIRAIQAGPRWNPGRQSGNTVKQRMIVPINFALQGLAAVNVENVPKESLSKVTVVGYPK